MARYLTVLFAILLSLAWVPGCRVESTPMPQPPATVAFSPTPGITPTFPPTWTPRPPTPTQTRVIPVPPTPTPGPSPTPTDLPARTKALVVVVQDSQTLEAWLESEPVGQAHAVRLLGIRPPLQSDPWSGVAVEWLAREIGRQVVVLERDEQERDAQGSLLRYVWHRGRLVNVTMVQMGLATAAEDAALLRFGEDLLAAQADARSAERGLWGPAPTLTPTRVVSTPKLTTPTLLSTLVLTATTAATSTLSP